jgi:hypothetical protein
MFYKCELLVGGYVYPVTEHIKNWDEITVSFKRNDYDGVVRSFTDKFEFVKGARQLLMDEYKKNYLKASANIVISTRNNSWTWTERFRCALNFSTLSDDGFVCSLNAVDDSLAAIIKARKGVQYEYLVDEVKDSMPLLYDGMDMTNNVVMTIPPNNEETDTVDITMEENGYYTIPLYIESSEIVRKGELELTDQMESFYVAADWIRESPYFFKNESKEYINVRMKMSIKVFYNSTNAERNDTFYIMAGAKGKLPVQHFSYTFPTPTFTSSINVDVEMIIPPSFGLQMYVHSQYGKSAVRITEIVEKPTITWVSRRDSIALDIVNPQTMLNRLLKSINGGKDGLNGVIVPSGEKRLDNAMILAAESARKMPNAKIYSSFDKFSKWMSSVFGYVYDINDKTVTFRPRKDYFTSEVVKTIEDYNNYTMNVNSSLIYSQVNVGYDKQDYDSVNGKDEFRFTNEYSTGITMTENKLELISPYRADAYGIEFLAQQIGEDTTDNSSDTDVFFVCVQSNGSKYILDRTDSIRGVISPLTMFNVMYSPTSMITANKAFLGGFIPELNYASSEGNTAVRINGNAENRDITLDGGLFNVNEVEIETSDIEIPSDMTGIVQFEHQGEILEGYYKSTDFNYTKTKSAKITLIVKK